MGEVDWEAQLGCDPVYEGKSLTIQSLMLGDGSCPVEEFLSGLNESDRRKLDVLFERLGESGKIFNREKFKKVENSEGIFEFKSFQIRILCFFSNKVVYLAHWVVKKGDKLRPADVKTAEERRRWYLQNQGG